MEELFTLQEPISISETSHLTKTTHAEVMAEDYIQKRHFFSFHNCNFSNNVAFYGGGLYGGGIYTINVISVCLKEYQIVNKLRLTAISLLDLPHSALLPAVEVDLP